MSRPAWWRIFPGLTNDAGDPLGLSGEVVTVDDGFGGVQTSLQITSTDGISLGSVELSHFEDLPVTQSTVQTDEFVATLEIPTDAEVSGFTGGAELEVSISGGGLSAPVSFSFTAGGFTTAQDLAQSLQSQITSQISGQQPDSELFVEVATDATSESGVSLVRVLPRLRSRRISILRVRSSGSRAVRVSRPWRCRLRFPRVIRSS